MVVNGLLAYRADRSSKSSRAASASFTTSMVLPKIRNEYIGPVKFSGDEYLAASGR